jgi:hypothetical protein
MTFVCFIVIFVWLLFGIHFIIVNLLPFYYCYVCVVVVIVLLIDVCCVLFVYYAFLRYVCCFRLYVCIDCYVLLTALGC